MQNLLPKALPLVVREFQDSANGGRDFVIPFGREIVPFGMDQGPVERIHFALGLLHGATEPVQRLACFGFCGCHCVIMRRECSAGKAAGTGTDRAKRVTHWT